MDRTTAFVEVERTLAAAGGGRVLCVGDDVSQLVAAFRARAVNAHGRQIDAKPSTLPNKSFDIVYVQDAIDDLVGVAREAAIRDLLRVTTLPRRTGSRKWTKLRPPTSPIRSSCDEIAGLPASDATITKSAGSEVIEAGWRTGRP